MGRHFTLEHNDLLREFMNKAAEYLPGCDETTPTQTAASPVPATAGSVTVIAPGSHKHDSIFIHSILDGFGLSASQFRVFANVARRHGTPRGAFSAIDRIAADCKLHPRTVRTALRFLVAHHLLACERRKGKPCVYRVLPIKEWVPVPSAEPSQSNTGLAPGTINLIQGCPAKAMQAEPSQGDADKGSQCESNNKEEVPPTLVGDVLLDLPFCEKDAVARAAAIGIDPDFARAEYHAKVGNWRDNKGNPISSWESHLIAYDFNRRRCAAQVEKNRPYALEKMLKNLQRQKEDILMGRESLQLDYEERCKLKPINALIKGLNEKMQQAASAELGRVHSEKQSPPPPRRPAVQTPGRETNSSPTPKTLTPEEERAVLAKCAALRAELEATT